MRTLSLALLFILLICTPQKSWGAFKSASDSISLDSAWNPKSEKDDIILPMPCGLSLALRAVQVPSGALIRDKTFPMGISNPQNQERQLYERQFYGHISAPFTYKDLPKQWQTSLLDDKKLSAGDTWYFIGKYEISQMQWEAVMNALNSEGDEDKSMCPRNGAKINLPISGISWFEAQDFLNKYNAWLIKYHAQELPAFSGTKNIAFLRLPTEEEWEYAAKGGANIPPEWWEDKDFFPFSEGKSLPDYGVFNSGTTYSEALPIGSRSPNPLGLYDTAGNVSEMVDGFFRMSIADMKDGRVERRLHGGAGGILTKGGSYRGTQEEVLPGWRDEAPLYTTSGPGRQSDLGLRIVLAGLNIPTAQKLSELRKEVSHTPDTTKKIDLSEAETPLAAIEKLAQVVDEDTRKHLQEIHSKLEDWENAEAALNTKRIEHTYRSLLYQAETLRAFAFRYSAVSKEIDKMRKLINTKLDSEDEKKAKAILAEAMQDGNDYLHSLEMGASYYKTSLGVLLDESDNELRRLASQAKQEYSGSGVFNEHMRHNIEIVDKNLNSVRKNGLASLQTNTILKEILPANHYKLLSQKIK